MLETRLTFLAVGQGNAFMLEVFGQGTGIFTKELEGLALFDFGGDSQIHPHVRSSISILCKAMERRGRRKGVPGYYLDFLCITHQDKDHWAYLNYFTRLAGLTIFSACINVHSNNTKFLNMCHKLPVQRPLYNLTAGTKYSLFDNPGLGVVYQVLAWGVGRTGGVQNCQDDSHGYNASSIVLKIGGNCPSFVLTGDATAHTMKYIFERWSREVPYSVVMSAPHHGSYTTAKGTYQTINNIGQIERHEVYTEFFNMLRPDRIVVSAGMHASYGHPHNTMINYYNVNLSLYGNTDKRHDIWRNQNDNKAQSYAALPVTSRLYTTQLGLDARGDKIFAHQLIEANAAGQVNHMAVNADASVTELPDRIFPIDNLNGSQRQLGFQKEQRRNIRSCRAVAHKVRNHAKCC